MSQSNWCFLLGVTDFNAPRPQAIFEHYLLEPNFIPGVNKKHGHMYYILYMCIYIYIQNEYCTSYI